MHCDVFHLNHHNVPISLTSDPQVPIHEIINATAKLVTLSYMPKVKKGILGDALEEMRGNANSLLFAIVCTNTVRLSRLTLTYHWTIPSSCAAVGAI